MKEYTFKTLEDVYKNLDQVYEEYKSSGLIVIKGLDLSDQEHIELSSAVSSLISSNTDIKISVKEVAPDPYRLDYSQVQYMPGPNSFILPMHLEHLETETAGSPIVLGVWRMVEFTAPAGTGDTVFVDTSKIFEDATPEMRDFLTKCQIQWNLQANPGDTTLYWGTATGLNMVSGKTTIRIEIKENESNVFPSNLQRYDGRTPTDEENELYSYCRDWYQNEVTSNSSRRYRHHWEKNDVLIFDVYRMAHGVYGGFEKGDRILAGILSAHENDNPLMNRRQR